MKAERLSGKKPARFMVACLVLAALLRLAISQQASGTAGHADHIRIPVTPRPGFGYAFGGSAVIGTGTSLDLGQTTDNAELALVSAAWAAHELRKSSCLTDAPIPAAGQRSGRQLDVADDMPGFYGAPWVARLNGNLVALLRVSVPRNPLLPVPAPVVQVYRPGKGAAMAATASFSGTPTVSVYRGSKALLYRMMLDGPVSCIDLVVPRGAGVGTGYVYYPVHGRIFEARGIFTIQR